MGAQAKNPPGGVEAGIAQDQVTHDIIVESAPAVLPPKTGILGFLQPTSGAPSHGASREPRVRLISIVG